jgi:hypothetical protein
MTRHHRTPDFDRDLPDPGHETPADECASCGEEIEDGDGHSVPCGRRARDAITICGACYALDNPSNDTDGDA